MNYLKDLRISKHMTQTEVANYLNISYQAYGYYETDKRQMTVDTARKLASLFKVPISLITGSSEVSDNAYEELGIKVPVVGTISAGLPLLATENIEDYEFAPSNAIKPNHTYFFLKVHGDSMNLRFQDGDIVLIEQTPDIEDGEIGAFLIDNDTATLKKLTRQNNLIILNPMSTNPIHQVQVYDPNKVPVSCLGRAVAYQGLVNKEG